MLQPCKGFVGLPAKGIHLSDLIACASFILGDEFRQGSIRIVLTAQRVINQRLTREFRPLVWFLLNFRERLLRFSVRDENFTQSEVDKGSLWVQLQSFLQLALGFIVSARE